MKTVHFDPALLLRLPPQGREAGAKALPDELAWLLEGDTWDALRNLLVPIVRPLFTESFMVGAQLATQQKPSKRGRRDDSGWMEDALALMRGEKAPPISLLDAGLGLPWMPFDFEAMLGASQEIISLYTDAWWLQFTQTTQNALRAIIARAEAESLSMPEIIDLVTPLFGPQRARAIAVTETTRLLGLGAQETYKRTGFSMWQWRTVNDARVDLVCEELGSQNNGDGAVFPMTTPFVPAHVNCRCWPVPYGDPTAPSALIPFDPAGLGSNFVA